MANKKVRSTTTDDPATDFARKAIEGVYIVGEHVANSCKRHLTDLESGDLRGLRWDLEKSNRVQQFFPDQLRLSGGQFEDNPFKLFPWQQFVIGSIFGWKLGDDTRRFTAAYTETGKGSGKSPLSGGIGIYMMRADGEAGAEVYAAAAKKEQAAIQFNDAAFMVEKSPFLSNEIKVSGVYPSVWAMSWKNSIFRPVSSDSRVSGPRPHCVLADEIHEMGRDGSVLTLLEQGFKFRRQPLLFMITNSGYDRMSICWEWHEKAIKAASGKEPERYDDIFSFVCSINQREQKRIFDTPEIWTKVNPSYPEIPTERYLKRTVNNARNSPSQRNSILRINFCVWTDSKAGWISAEAWEAIQHQFDDEWMNELRGQECYGGLDLSKKRDLTALVLTFPRGRHIDMLSWFWMPEGSDEKGTSLPLRAKAESVPYDVWHDEGHLMVSKGPEVNYADVAKKIQQLSNIYKIQSIAFDPYKIEDLRKEMEKIQCDVALKEHAQGQSMTKATDYWMPGSIEELESAIAHEKLRVKENYVLTMCATSAEAKQIGDQGNVIFSKKESPFHIDGIVAAAMSFAPIRKKPKKKRSVYEQLAEQRREQQQDSATA